MPRAGNLPGASSTLELQIPRSRALAEPVAEHTRAKRQKSNKTSVILETRSPQIYALTNFLGLLAMTIRSAATKCSRFSGFQPILTEIQRTVLTNDTQNY
jgi:hypothetical protein